MILESTKIAIFLNILIKTHTDNTTSLMKCRPRASRKRYVSISRYRSASTVCFNQILDKLRVSEVYRAGVVLIHCGNRRNVFGC